MFIQASSELGIAGLVVILLVFLTAFHRHRLLRKVFADRGEVGRFPYHLSHGLDASLVGLAVSGSFLTVLYYPHLWLLLGVSAAATNVALNQARKTEALDASGGNQRGVLLTEAR